MKRQFLFYLLAAEFLFFAVFAGPKQISVGYFQNYFVDLFTQAAPLLILAFGMTLVMSTGGIDLSVGSMAALVAAVLALFPGGNQFWWTALPCGLAVGLFLGALNGLLIARLEVPPIVATLGTMILYRGLCFTLLGDVERSPFLDVPGYNIFSALYGVTPVIAGAYLAGGLWFSRSRWRSELLLVGANRVAARYAGLPVFYRYWQVYTLLGLCAFFAALFYTGRNGSVSGSVLTGLELQVIVAVVLGGTRVQGGFASLPSTFVGVLIIAVLQEGLRGMAANFPHSPVNLRNLEFLALGALLLAGVWLNSRVRQDGSRV